MSQYINKIRTESGDLQIDYNALANLPANPNLLINSNFRRSINQRTQTTYTNTKDWSWCYTIDRWACNASLNSCAVVVNKESLTITNNGNSDMHFRQLFDIAYDTGNYTATINVLSVTGTVVVHFDAGNRSGALVAGKNVITLHATPEHFNFLISAGASIEINYVKLEQGDVATPFIPKLAGEEFALCSRYYQKLYNNAGELLHAVGRSRSTTTARVFLNLTTTLRTCPEVCVNNLNVVNATTGVWSLVDRITGVYIAMNQIVLDATIKSDQTELAINAPYYFLYEIIELDAEIY